MNEDDELVYYIDSDDVEGTALTVDDSDSEFAIFDGQSYLPTSVIMEYSELLKKPTINGITVEGNKNSSDYLIPSILFDTTTNWNSNIDLIADAKVLYVYTDYMVVDGKNVAGFKVGDGSSYLIDMPFMDAGFIRHIYDNSCHITEAEREFWNNKNRAIAEGETLILTIN